MGDRGNIVVKQSKDVQPLYLYGHWAGEDILATTYRALRHGKDRLTDAPYLTRILFCALLSRGYTNASEAISDTKSYGISVNQPQDNEHAHVVVDIPAQTVSLCYPLHPAPLGPVIERRFGQNGGERKPCQWGFEEFLALFDSEEAYKELQAAVEREVM